MALILSAASGNFNAGATWVGGIVPGVGDEARASTTHTITITANVTCTEISNAGTGTYVLNSGVTLTANCTNKSATASVNLLTFSAASPATASIVGTCTSGTIAVSQAVSNNGSGTLNITGNAVGGTGTGGVVVNTSTGNITLTGNATGGTGGALGAGNSSTGTGIFTLIGNATGASVGSVGYGAFNNGAGTLNITGNVQAAAATGVTNASTGTLTITGNITAATAAGVTNVSTATLTISGGTYTASNVANAVISTNASSVVRASGSFIYASNGFVPINTPKFILLTTPTLAKTRYALNGSTTYVDMFTADNSLGQAAITDVRFGTVYASGALTGVAYIPAAGSVAAGTPVDNTVGTATLTAANVRAAIGMASANLDTQLSTISTKASEVHAIHGLDIANALTVTPTLRSAGAITQAITGDGTTNTIVTRV